MAYGQTHRRTARPAGGKGASRLRRLALNRLDHLNIPLPSRRYQLESSGNLLHLDIKQLRRFRQPGHRAHGDRRRDSPGAGWECVHVAIDDASRIVFAEILVTKRQESVVAVLPWPLRFYKALGITVRRIMADNGNGYVSGVFRKACAKLCLKHIRIRPYTPCTNGKVERFTQKALREWAYAASYAHSMKRASELPRWLHEYIFYRNRYLLPNKAPISGVVKVINNALQPHN